MRKVLVHYHLFKNAGSSIDSCLSDSFATQWHAFDPDANTGVYTANQLQSIIEAHPSTIAFSSHCLVPPLLTGSVKVSPIIILREPISRVLSAYAFEWQKQKGTDQPVGELSDYIEAKFKLRRRNAIENFQTMRLAVTDPDARNPDVEKSDAELIEAACAVIEALPAFGLVEQFDRSVAWLQQAYQTDFPELALQPVATNVTQTKSSPLWERHSSIAEKIGADLFSELILRNQMDIQLYAFALGRFNALAPSATDTAIDSDGGSQTRLSA